MGGAETAVEDFQDMSEVMVGPTRGNHSIDHFFCNVARSVSESGTLPPLRLSTP